MTMTINELREKRNTAWENAKDFLKRTVWRMA